MYLGEISEALVVHDLMFVFQGIDGKYITLKKNDEGFRVSEKVGTCTKDYQNFGREGERPIFAERQYLIYSQDSFR